MDSLASVVTLKGLDPLGRDPSNDIKIPQPEGPS